MWFPKREAVALALRARELEGAGRQNRQCVAMHDGSTPAGSATELNWRLVVVHLVGGIASWWNRQRIEFHCNCFFWVGELEDASGFNGGVRVQGGSRQSGSESLAN